MQFTPHILHNYSLFSIYSQSKNGVSRRKNCYILLKNAAVLSSYNNKREILTCKNTGIYRLLNSDVFLS